MRAAVIDDDSQFREKLLDYLDRYSSEKGIRIDTEVFPDALDFVSDYKRSAT